MNEQNYPSSQVMIKIDGARIRAIREAKGLTQLYVATAVEVTTDTVSRWENRRYPTIKKENGLKLAQALEVELEDILDRGDEADISQDEAEPAAPEIEPPPAKPETGTAEEISTSPDQADQPDQPSQFRWYSSFGHLTIILITALLVGGAFSLYQSLRGTNDVPGVNVTRIVPPHFIAGQPLPVFLHIDKPDDATVSAIIKENLPPGTSLESALPALSGSSGTEIKWLRKLAQPALFFYTVTTPPTYAGELLFSGVMKNGSDDEAIAITGNTRSVSGSHHWADTDRDNRISDEEILVIYDLLSDNSEQLIDLDQIEEMWLGDGYVWNPELQSFTIIE